MVLTLHLPREARSSLSSPWMSDHPRAPPAPPGPAPRRSRVGTAVPAHDACEENLCLPATFCRHCEDGDCSKRSHSRCDSVTRSHRAAFPAHGGSAGAQRCPQGLGRWETPELRASAHRREQAGGLFPGQGQARDSSRCRSGAGARRPGRHGPCPAGGGSAAAPLPGGAAPAGRERPAPGRERAGRCPAGRGRVVSPPAMSLPPRPRRPVLKAATAGAALARALTVCPHRTWPRRACGRC